MEKARRMDITEEDYYDIIKRKTASLIASCCVLGALSVNADEIQVERMKQFGTSVGIAFQIKDDIFDYYASDELGKPTGNDMKEGKLTLPSLYVLNTLKDESTMALALKIRALEADDKEIAQFIEYVKANGGIEYAIQTMTDYRNKALEVLPQTLPQELKDALTAYIDFVIERKK